jgi:hypothetical protein
MPSHRLDRASTSPGTEPFLRLPTRIGVFPIPVCAPPRGERRGRVGEVEAEQEEAVASPLARHCWGSSGTLGAGRGKAVRDSGGAEPEWNAPVNTNAAPPSTSSLRRLHHRPAVSTVATPFLAPPSYLVHVCWRTFEPPRAERAALPFTHERPPRRAMPARSRRRGYPRPRRPGALVYGWLPRCLAGGTKDFPAPRCRALHRARVVPCV